MPGEISVSGDEVLRQVRESERESQFGKILAALLAGILIGAVVVGCMLHVGGFLAFGEVNAGDIAGALTEQREKTKRKLDDFEREMGVFRDELDKWEHHIERRIGAKPIGAPVGSP